MLLLRPRVEARNTASGAPEHTDAPPRPTSCWICFLASPRLQNRFLFLCHCQSSAACPRESPCRPAKFTSSGGLAASIMEKHDDEAKAGNARQEVGREADDLSVSLTGSSVEIDEKRHQHGQADEPGASDDKKVRPASDGLGGEAASAYSTDSSHSTERGEADLENEDIEETVPGRDLDRQLSRVGHSVTYFYSSNNP